MEDSVAVFLTRLSTAALRFATTRRRHLEPQCLRRRLLPLSRPSTKGRRFSTSPAIAYSPASNYPGATVATTTTASSTPREKDGMGKLSVQQLKTPKGTRDWIGSDMILRDRIFQSITDVFKRHGGTALDTPVFELRDILAGKYGEDSKLIYDLQDQGGEICSLRYDLTVPLARFLAMNSSIQQLKRYQISKVYRRDQPAMTKGRMREFYQCDFDIAGTYDAMIPDAEILSIIVEVFRELEWDNITIKINHRKILDGLFAVAGVPADKIRTISSAVDKLDKAAWSEVRREMTVEKGLDQEVADRIGAYVKHKGGRNMVALLRADEKLMANADASKGVDEMDKLFGYLEALGVADKLSFDLSLARGLDYYTGLIYEVVTEGSAPPAPQIDEQLKATLNTSSKKKPLEDGDDRSNDPTIGVGSIAAGGRYDNLVGMFSGKRQIPCVGISFGVDRIFSVMKARMERENDAALSRSSEVDVFVMAFGMGKDFTGLLPERMALARDLWAANIRTEFLQKVKPKLPQQFTAAENKGIPLAVILGEDEVKQGVAKLKVMGLEKFNLPDGHPDKTGRVVQRASLVDEIRRELSAKRWINYVELDGEKE